MTLIVGAGPYGLSVAAALAEAGRDFTLLGEPMEFWWRGMPDGMLLRSGLDWHLDPDNRWTLRAFLPDGWPEDRPLPVEVFREYGAWFQERVGLRPDPRRVRRLAREGDGFAAHLDGGDTLRAERVVVAAGFAPFPWLPDDVTSLLPPGRVSHTCHTVRFEALRDARVLVVGGRQSAFEWAALLTEQVGARVHVACRHEVPRFEPSDWAWIEPLVQRSEEVPGWFAGLPREEREAIAQRFWDEGRRKLEPWLAPRLQRVQVHPHCRVAGSRETSQGLEVRLEGGPTLEVDHVILATGYRPDPSRLDWLCPQTLLPHLQDTLDPQFCPGVPGLHLVSLLSSPTFGPFYAFVRGAAPTARILRRAMGTSPP